MDVRWLAFTIYKILAKLILGRDLRYRAAVKIAAVLAEQGLFEESLEFANYGVEINHQDYRAWFLAALSLARLNRLRAAAEAFEVVVSLRGDRADYWRFLGDALLAVGPLSEALEAYEEAANLDDPDGRDDLNLAGLGHVCRLTKQYDIALEYYDDAAQLYPDWADHWQNRAACLYELGDFADAIASAEAALELAPGHPVALALIEHCEQQLEATA
ncbi:MAG: tetratricopeptide repeat protein [Cyanobacteria bacterium P01_H01_bin.121]